MKIHRLHLQHVKGVADAEIELPDSGVVVIEGPNEVGKSTFLEALDRLLDPKAKAHSKAAAIVALQPVGQDVGPFVEAELSIGPYRLVFSKRWLRQSATTLRVLEPAPEQHTGEAAQARMTAIVDECLDRPLFEALRFAQVGPTSQIRLADSTVLAQALDSAAGADLHTESGTDLLHAVETEYTRYFTAVSGKPSGELRLAMSAFTQAQDAVAEAHRRLLEAEELVRSRDTLAARVQAAQRELPTLREEQAQLAEVVAQAERLRAREHEAARAMAAADQHRERVDADLLARQRLSREVEARAESALSQEEHLETRLIEANEAVENLRLATDALQIAKRACATGQGDADAAAVKVADMAAAAELAALTQRVESAQALQTRLDAARKALQAAVVSPVLLRQIEQAEHRVALALSAVEASATVVRVQSLQGAHQVSLDGASQALGADDGPLDFHVVRGTEFTLDGSVRIEVSPHADVQRRATDCESMRDDLDARLAAVGASDVERARELAEEYRRAQAEVTELERLFAAALAGNNDLSELRAQRDERQLRLLQQHSDYAGGHEQASGAGNASQTPVNLPSPSSPTDIDQARHEARVLQRSLGPLRKARDQAEDEVGLRRETESRATRGHDVLSTQHAHAAIELALLRDRLDEARRGTPDGDLEEALTHAQGDSRAAHLAHDDAAAEIRSSGVDDTQARLTQLDSQVARAGAHLGTLRGQFHELKGRLEMTAGEGRAEEHDRAGQRLAEAKRQLSSIGRRARAARQLHITLRRHRDSAHASYVAPYAHEIERFGKAMYGSSFAVRVSPDLVITHRELNGVLVGFDHLSGGAKEQLGILARLAVAVLVDAEQAVPVMIDDALGYTDPDRLQRLGAVLDGASPLGQIVLLTCTPQRYAAIPGAHVLSIPA